MTEREAIEHLKFMIEISPKEPPEECDYIDEWWKGYNDMITSYSMSIDALEFARWVAEKIFSGMLEEDPELFCELACRRLIKLGMVRPKGLKEWQIVGTPLDDMIEKLYENMSREDILQKRLPEPYEEQEETTNT